MSVFVTEKSLTVVFEKGGLLGTVTDAYVPAGLRRDQSLRSSDFTAGVKPKVC